MTNPFANMNKKTVILLVAGVAVILVFVLKSKGGGDAVVLQGSDSTAVRDSINDLENRIGKSVDSTNTNIGNLKDAFQKQLEDQQNAAEERFDQYENQLDAQKDWYEQLLDKLKGDFDKNYQDLQDSINDIKNRPAPDPVIITVPVDRPSTSQPPVQPPVTTPSQPDPKPTTPTTPTTVGRDQMKGSAVSAWERGDVGWFENHNKIRAEQGLPLYELPTAKK